MTLPFRLFVFLLSPVTIFASYVVFYEKQFMTAPGRQWFVVILLALNLSILVVNLVRWISGKMREERILGLVFPLSAILLSAHFITLFTLHTLEEVTVSNLNTYDYMVSNIDSLEACKREYGYYPAGDKSLAVGLALEAKGYNWYRWDGWQNDFEIRISDDGTTFSLYSHGFDRQEGKRLWPFYFGHLNPDLDIKYDTTSGWSKVPQPILK